jgi:lysophospholipase L1-like esterase
MHRSGVGSNRVATAAALLLVAVGGTACESEAPTPDEGFVYAALGDSYTAAPELPTISTEGCFRSDHNYPHLVARQLDDVTLRDVSCGGARTDAVLQSQVQTEADRVQPPQIDAVTADTDLVTIGMGVNDLGFVVTAAFGCLLVAENDPRGAPCEEDNAEKVPRLLENIQDRLVDVVEAIANRAPEARILVVGYPRLLPDSGGCPKRFPIADGDVAFVRESFDRLNETVEAAADEAGVEYVDVATASEGHDICSDEPWINGKHENKRTGASPYHPTPAEQQAVAELILDLL